MVLSHATISSRVVDGFPPPSPKHRIYDTMPSFKMYARRVRHKMVALDLAWSIRLDAIVSERPR
jgi:hypothetical protein